MKRKIQVNGQLRVALENIVPGNGMFADFVENRLLHEKQLLFQQKSFYLTL